MVYFQSFLLVTPILTIFIFYFLGKFTNVFAARYLIYSIPLVLAGLGALKFQSQFSILVLVGLGLFFDFHIKPGENKGMDYRLAAKLVREQNLGPESAILLQTHDIAPLFTYYYDFDLLRDWYPEDRFRWERKEFAKAAAAKKGVKQNMAEELLILNY
jgi:hypothetical protein